MTLAFKASKRTAFSTNVCQRLQKQVGMPTLSWAEDAIRWPIEDFALQQIDNALFYRLCDVVTELINPLTNGRKHA